MTKLTFNHVYNRFGIHNCYGQQVSFATLLDADGNVVTPEVILECDGADHARGIEGVIDDYWGEVARLNGTGDYAEAVEREHAA